MTAFLNSSCDKALFGWPCDQEIEALRDKFSRSGDQAEKRKLAEAIQVRLSQYPTHVHLGQYKVPAAIRKNVTGTLQAPVPLFWNVKKE